jgi:hypothetical protein
MNARAVQCARAFVLGVILAATVSVVSALGWRPEKLVESMFAPRWRMAAWVEFGGRKVDASERKWWARYENDWAGEATVAYGWPLPAVRGFAILGSGRPITSWESVYWGAGAPSTRARFNEGPLFPTDVVWLGAAIDVAVFTGLAWLTLTGLGWRRKTSRERRGLCARCGYDLTGTVADVCPECGTVVHSRAAG